MKVCKYCGSESPDSATICSSCGANEFKHKCENCGTVFENGNFCPKCGVKAGAKAKKCPRCGAEYYSAACPDCGYTNSADNITVVYADAAPQPVKERKTWLWVLGWIFAFPVPLTILLVRNQKVNKWLKIGIIAVAWIIYILIAFSGIGSSNNFEAANNNQGKSESAQQEINSSSGSNTSSDHENMSSKEGAIKNLVNGFNNASENKLEYVEDFVVSDKDSGHYRTEFRLNAYSNAVGKSYEFEGQVVDIVSTQSISGDVDIRIYTDGATLAQCEALVQYASKILDSTMSDKTITDTIAYMEDKKEANGYYYGELGLLLLVNDSKGYNLMIKTD